MKINTYTSPKSSFLSIEKDMNIISSQMLKNTRLKKLLYYNSIDALQKPELSDKESIELFKHNIKLIPKLKVSSEEYNYIIISFDDFIENFTNPQFRDNTIEFDILCHYDNWQLMDFQLRPYRIAAEIDSTFNNQHLTGIGTLHFISGQFTESANQEYGGICLKYRAIHGEEDKKRMPNPADEEKFLADFNKMFNQK